MSIRTARDVLLYFRWKKNELSNLSIVILSRGAPEDRAYVSGSEIVHLGRSFMLLRDDTMIPYHRITKVIADENTIWKRDRK